MYFSYIIDLIIYTIICYHIFGVRKLYTSFKSTYSKIYFINKRIIYMIYNNLYNLFNTV